MIENKLNTMEYNTDFEVKKAQIVALQGDSTSPQNIYEADIEILKNLPQIDDASLSTKKVWSSSKTHSAIVDVSADVEDVSTRLNTTNNNLYDVSSALTDVSTDVQDVSSRLNITNENLYDVSVDLADVSADLQDVSVRVSQMSSDALVADELPINIAIQMIDASLKLKQDKISDLSTIRSGAALGATALQTVPANYVKFTQLTQAEYDALATKDVSTLYIITDA